MRKYDKLSDSELLELYLGIRGILDGAPLNDIRNTSFPLFDQLSRMLKHNSWLIEKEGKERIVNGNHAELEFWFGGKHEYTN